MVSHACIGVAANVSPIPVYPCTANHGAPHARTAETDSLNSQLPDDVVHVIVLRGAIHREP
jgi:hypothetical protein